MINMRRCLAIPFTLVVLGLVAAPAMALTAQEIADSVIDELDNVSDYTATVDVDYDDVDYDDMTDGTLQLKRNGGTWKTRNVDGTPNTCTVICDGTVWNRTDTEEPNAVTLATKADGDSAVRYLSAGDLFNMENVLTSETWSKDAGTETVNSVSCYRLYTTKDDTNFEVWIDVSTVTKVIRVKVTDLDDDLRWRLDYSDYSDVENTAQLPATIVTTLYDDDTPTLTVTYSLSDIDINEGLSDTLFECQAIPE